MAVCVPSRVRFGVWLHVLLAPLPGLLLVQRPVVRAVAPPSESVAALAVAVEVSAKAGVAVIPRAIGPPVQRRRPCRPCGAVEMTS